MCVYVSSDCYPLQIVRWQSFEIMNQDFSESLKCQCKRNWSIVSRFAIFASELCAVFYCVSLSLSLSLSLCVCVCVCVCVYVCVCLYVQTTPAPTGTVMFLARVGCSSPPITSVTTLTSLVKNVRLSSGGQTSR